MQWHLDAIRPRLETGVQIQLEVTRTVPILCVYCVPFLSTVNHECWSNNYFFISQLKNGCPTGEVKWPRPGRGLSAVGARKPLRLLRRAPMDHSTNPGFTVWQTKQAEWEGGRTPEPRDPCSRLRAQLLFRALGQEPQKREPLS